MPKYLSFLVFIFVVNLSCKKDPDMVDIDLSGTGKAGDGLLATKLEELRSTYNLPAIGAMLVDGNSILEMDVTGKRSFNHGEIVSIDDKWHLTSLTKSMTSTMIARMVEDSKVSWFSTVGEIFPEWDGLIDDAYLNVNFVHLLSHTSGLGVDISRVPAWGEVVKNESDLVELRNVWAYDLLFEIPFASLGTFLYTDAGYIVVAAMLEKITGQPWEELMEVYLFEPLGIQSGGFGAPGNKSNRDHPWGHVVEGSTWRALDPTSDEAANPPALGPAESVHMSMRDYAKYMQMHLAGATGTSPFLMTSTFQQLHSPLSNGSYSLGWSVITGNPQQGLEHTGSDFRWYAWVYLSPVDNVGLFAVTNAGTDGAGEAMDKVLDLLSKRYLNR